MKLVFVIKNRDETPFMIVTSTPQGSTFKPASKNAKELAKMLSEEYKEKPISKPELVQTMDASKIIEGPSPSGTATQKKIANTSLVKKELEMLPVLSISEVLLSEFSNEEFKNVLTFKASSFISDQTRSSAHFEIKGVRAIWDPSLSIPGTNRRGGFRCPVGTRYGGQITDRFGRSCGWGIARRIANQIADIGERLELRDDDKRKRRLDRRNARMIRRLGGVPEQGRLEGGLRNVAERLEGGQAPQGRRIRDRLIDFGDQIGDDIRPGSVLDRVVNPGGQRNRRRDTIPETAPKPKPKTPKKNLSEEREDREFLQRVLEGHPDGEPGPVWEDWIGVTKEDLPIIERLVKKGFLRKQKNDTQAGGAPDPDRAKYSLEVTTAGKEFLNGKNNPAPKPRPAKQPAPAGKRPQARPRVAPQPENVDVLTARDASDAEASEAFKPYVLRKYNEYAKRVREIREGGGNAGMLTRREWYAINKDNLRDAWKNVHGRSAPEDFDPPTPKPRRPRNNRGRRRQATAQGAGRATTRKPKPDDVPEPAPARPVRPARRNKVAEEQAARNALQNALTEANQDPGYVLGNEKFDEDVEAILRQPQAVPEKELSKLIGMLEEQEDQLRARNRLARQMGQRPDPDDVAMLQRLSPQHRKLREAQAEARLARNASSAPPSPPSPPNPPSPPSPKTENIPELKMNNLVDHHQTEMPKLQPKNGEFVSVPKGNKGINTKEDAMAYKGSLADVPDDFLLDALDARTIKSSSQQPLTQELNDALRKVLGQNLSDNDIKRKLADFASALKMAAQNDVQLNQAELQEKIAIIKALKENGIDFLQRRVGAGVTSPEYYFLLDEDPKKWGRGYFLKKPDQTFDGWYHGGNAGSQHSEIIGNILAKEIGFANGSPRITNGDDTGPFLLQDIFLNNAEGKLRGGYDVDKITNAESRLLNGILNAVMDAGDRHGGNGDVFSGNGAIPLDFGRADFEKKTAEEMVSYFGNDFGMDPKPYFLYKKRLRNLQGEEKRKEADVIKQELQNIISAARQKMTKALSQLEQVDKVFDALDDDTKMERRENLIHNLEQLGDPKFLAGLMTAILRP